MKVNTNLVVQSLPYKKKDQTNEIYQNRQRLAPARCHPHYINLKKKRYTKCIRSFTKCIKKNSHVMS